MLSVFKKSLWTKELIAWYLYDFANSFIFINMLIYFSQWVVVDNGLSDFWFSLPVILATIVLIFLSTHIGNKGDKHGSHFKIFRIVTILTIISVIALIIAGRGISNNYGVIVALVFFGIYQIFYQLSFVPYNAFMKHISSKEGYGKVSGIGMAIGQLGNIMGLIITLPLINKSITLFGTDRLAPLIPGLIVFFIFLLPIFIIYRKKQFPAEKNEIFESSFLKSFWNNLKESKKQPGVFPLLLCFYLFSDAITTITLYSAIYLERVFLISDAAKVGIFILITAGLVVGAFLGGILSDKYSHRKILVISLILNAITIVFIAINQEVNFLNLIFALFGITMGVVYASSRSYLASLIPTEESGKFFGLYTFSERVASIIGPLVWGIVILAFASITPVNYRIAAFVMGIFVFLAAIPLTISYKKRSTQ